MGKKFAIYYNAYIAPAIKGPNANGEKGLDAFNLRHSFSADVVIARRVSVGISIQPYNTMVHYTDYLWAQDPNYSYTYYGYIPHSGLASVRGRNQSIYFKFFSRRYIAPWGIYNKLELMRMSYTVKYEESDFSGYVYMYRNGYPGSNVLVTPELGRGIDKFSDVAIAWTVGKQRILHNRLVVDYGVQSGLALKSVKHIISPESYTHSAIETNSLYIEHGARKRMFNSLLFNFTIGIGFLAI